MSGMLVDGSVAGVDGGAFYARWPAEMNANEAGAIRINNCRADQDGGALYLENTAERPFQHPRFPLVARNNMAGRNGGGM